MKIAGVGLVCLGFAFVLACSPLGGSLPSGGEPSEAPSVETPNSLPSAPPARVEPSKPSPTAEAPSVVSSGQAPLEVNQDRADTDCHVILRRSWIDYHAGRPAVECSEGLCWWVFKGQIDVAQGALEKGMIPALLYNSTSSDPGAWWEATTYAVGGAASGFSRYEFKLSRHTIRDGITASGLDRSQIALIPFLRSPQGGRLFDHNRLPDPFDNYKLKSASRWEIPDAPAICGPKAHATLRFLTGWQNHQDGALVQGGHLSIEYDLYRLPECMGSSYMGQAAWDTLAYLRFLPGGQVLQIPIPKEKQADGRFLSRPAHASIPKDASRLDVWFQTSGRSCAPAWDSQMGQNYAFEVQTASPAAVVWAGDWGSATSRSCERRDGVPEPLVLDSYIMERACKQVFADVYIPALTDRSEIKPHLVQARVHYRLDGGPTQTARLTFVQRVGNNYRFVWLLPDADLRYNPTWQKVFYSFAFSTDGVRWFRIGQADGPEGGDDRSIQRGF